MQNLVGLGLNVSEVDVLCDQTSTLYHADDVKYTPGVKNVF